MQKKGAPGQQKPASQSSSSLSQQPAQQVAQPVGR
jgi:hypothetical protein